MRMDLGAETHRNENAELDKGRNGKKAPQPPEKKFNLLGFRYSYVLGLGLSNTQYF